VTDPRAANDRVIALWLLACCAMIFLMVVIGGITRLTESGLSITEWKPITGVLPPLSEAAWQAEFEKYKQIPEYRYVHYGMTLTGFKSIFFWEYIHRLWGRLIGVVFAVPFLWFLVRGRIRSGLWPQLAALFLLGGLQGFVGWYMVKSGLADRVDVSQYRLVAHLGLALFIYGAMLWMALGLLPQSATEVPAHAPPPAGLRRLSSLVVLMVFVTLLSGGFVAKLNAGLIYNTFPLMDGRWIPEGYAQMEPFWRNWFENIPAVQFNHRLLAMSTAAVTVLTWLAAQRLLPAATSPRRASHVLLAVAALQIALGISTLLLVVPIPLAAAHQAGAVVLLTAAIVLRHRLRAPAPARVLAADAQAPALGQQGASVRG
jgi:cytochrome c oxidase assembly protein subunit 15